MKNYANRRIRSILVKTDEDWVDPVHSGNSYKHYTCSWDICDYKWLYFGGFKELERDRKSANRHWTFNNLRMPQYTPEEIAKEWREYRNK